MQKKREIFVVTFTDCPVFADIEEMYIDVSIILYCRIDSS